ncbi:MAG TPA: ROK family transcriptional regulator [Candidatus Dormibacteraeota bacterium]|nr:ROK family transcriptional regulator [Candidatus Dormibacteraeota bacterium]
MNKFIEGFPFRSNGVRRANTLALLDIFRSHRRTTRTELIRLSGLSKATISEIVDDLIGQGFIHEAGKFQAGLGRSRVVLAFDPGACLVIGVQVQDDVCEAVLADLDASPRERVTVEFHGTGPDLILDAVERAVKQVRERATAPVIGVGIGVPGSVEPTGRRVTIAVSHGWRDVAIADPLEARLGLPVLAANRAKVAALGEIWNGDARGVQDLVYVFLGTGLVAGIVVRGRLLLGTAGGAGEIGHTIVDPEGELCGCGNRGCLHTLASEGAILQRARAAARNAEDGSLLHRLTDGALGTLTLDQLGEAARRGDPAAVATLTQVGGTLGLVVTNLVHTLNPEKVVIGGPTVRLGEPLLAPLRSEFRRRVLGDLIPPLDIVASNLGAEAGAIGAAALFLTLGPSPFDERAGNAVQPVPAATDEARR